MHLEHGPNRRVIPLQGTQRYRPEEVCALMAGVTRPIWIVLAGQRMRLSTVSTRRLAATLVSVYHNDLVDLPPDDGWAEDTARAEEEARAHMEAESSSDEEYVTSDEDLVYEHEVYI